MVAIADALGVGIDQLLGRAREARKRRAGPAPEVRRLADLAERLGARGQRALLAAAEATTSYGRPRSR